MSDTVWVCAKCGAEDSISELLTVEIAAEGWRGVKVETGDDGVPKSTPERDNSGVDRDSADLSRPDWQTADCYAFHCAECERQSPTLAKAVRVKRLVECRDCGFSGQTEDHPAECDGELIGAVVPEPIPGQLTLEIAA